MKKAAMILALALGVSAWSVTAQEQGGPPPSGQRPPGREGASGGPGGPGGERRGPGGPGGMGGQRPVSPIVAALDLNHDGTIDAGEIAKAAESLKKLDKNGDGKLTPDEFLPQRPGGPGGKGGPGGEGRRGGPGGQRGPGGQGSSGGEGRPQRPDMEK